MRAHAGAADNHIKSLSNSVGMVIAGWVFWLAGCSGGFQADPLVEYSTDVVVPGDKTLTLSRHLDAGQYLLEIRERDIDLRVGIDVGTYHAELADAPHRHGLQRTVVSLAAPARLRITLTSTDHRSWKGAAAVRILRWPKAVSGEPPDPRLLGFQALGEGARLVAGRSPEEWLAALTALNEAARHFQAANDPQSQAEAEYQRGHVELGLLSDLDGGRRTAQLALAHFRDAGDHLGAQRAAVLLATAELALADGKTLELPRSEQLALADGAKRRLRSALQYFEARNLQSDALATLQLSATHDPAFDHEALRRRARLRGDRFFEARAIQNLGHAAFRAGDMARAAALYESAIPLVERERDPVFHATLQSDLGAALTSTGELERALKLHSEALRVFSARADDGWMAHALTALAAVQFRGGDLERALATVENAVSLYARTNDRIGHASALRLAGNAAGRMGRHELAASYLRESERRSGDDRTRVLLARELRMLGNSRGAEVLLARVSVTSNAAIRADALAERARLRAQQQRQQEALADLREADDIYTRLKLDFNRIDSGAALALALLDAGEVDQARQVADSAVAIESRLRARAGGPDARARFLSASYAPYEARIEVDLATLPGDADALWRAFQTAESIRARSLSDRLTWQQRATPDSRAAVQAALPVDTAVLAYFVGDQRSHAWLLTHNRIRHETLPGRQILEQLVNEVVARRNAAPQATADASSATLLGSLLGGVTARRLLILPDGPLHGLPFAALPLPGTRTRELLVDRFAIGSAPSLAVALGAPAGTRGPGIRIAVVSDPVYTPDDRRLSALPVGASRYRGPDEFSDRLARLPYSAIEARAVARAFDERNIIELAGFDATAGRVIGLPSQELAVLHFATHAVVREDAPGESALFLSEYAADGSVLPEDRLTADDIRRSGLRADVVVLSGCATGDGHELRGEGVLGLTYGFLANGSNTVVASLWPVEDALTARFMKEFYAAYRVSGRVSDALRTAQLRTRDTAGPSVWSSFVARSNGLP